MLENETETARWCRFKVKSAQFKSSTVKMTIEHVWGYFQSFLEQYGWRIVAFCFMFYVVKLKYTEYATHKHIQRTLAEANGTVF